MPSQPPTSQKDKGQDRLTIEELSAYFPNYKDAMFVFYSEKEQLYTVYNNELSATRMSPFSTFKIVNSLIGLETGVVKDENAVFKWDGFHYQFSDWNRDHTLQSAIEGSVVWYYQRVAAEVGRTRMQHYLNAIPYGNTNMSGTLIDFWLNSSLKISPKEQIDLLRRLKNNNLPFSKRSMEITRKILVTDKQNGATLSGKTGANGWFVGYVETSDNVSYFATKLGKDLAPGQALIFNGSQAKVIALKILQDKHIYNGSTTQAV